jgi:hypothetical protein
MKAVARVTRNSIIASNPHIEFEDAKIWGRDGLKYCENGHEMWLIWNEAGSVCAPAPWSKAQFAAAKRNLAGELAHRDSAECR